MLFVIQNNNKQIVTIKPRHGSNKFKPFIVTFRKKDQAQFVKHKLELHESHIELKTNQIRFYHNLIDQNIEYSQETPGYEMENLMNTTTSLGRDIFIVDDITSTDTSLCLDGKLIEIHEV